MNPQHFGSDLADNRIRIRINPEIRIRITGSASTVLTATGQVNGRWRILTRHRIETHTHEPTAIKFRTIDYVRERIP